MMRMLLPALLALTATAQEEDSAVFLQNQFAVAPEAAEDVEAPQMGLPDILHDNLLDRALLLEQGREGFRQSLAAMEEAGAAMKSPGDAWDLIHRDIANRFLAGIEDSSNTIDAIFQQIVVRLDAYDNRARMVADTIAQRVTDARPDRRGIVVKRWTSGFLEQTKTFFVEIGQMMAETADVATDGVLRLNPGLGEEITAGFDLARSELRNFSDRLDRAIQTVATMEPGHPAENGMTLQQVVASLESGVRRATDFKTHFDATFERFSAACVEKIHNHTQNWGADEARTYDNRASVALGRLSHNASHIAEDLLSSIVLIESTVNAAVQPFLKAIASDASAVRIQPHEHSNTEEEAAPVEESPETEMSATNSPRAVKEGGAEHEPTSAPGAEQSREETVSIKDAVDSEEAAAGMSATNSPRAVEEASQVHEPTRAPGAERSDEETVSIEDATNEAGQATHEDTSENATAGEEAPEAASTTEVAVEAKSAGVRAAGSALAAFAAAAGLLQWT